MLNESGCGAVGSALPWGGRGRKFKSCHSDQESEDDKSSDFSLFYKGFPHFSGADFLFLKPLKNERKNAKNRFGTRFGTRVQKVYFKKE